MFGGKKFLTDGTATNGVLIESESEKVAVGSGGTGRYRVRVRVTFDDGTLGEFDTKLHVTKLRRSGAPREDVGKWVHENEALDARYRALKEQHPEWQPPTVS